MDALTVTGLTKHFGSHAAVEGINFTVQSGEVHGFLGPNGAGKTTTIRCILDFIRPTSGSIQVFGHDTKIEGIAARAKIGYAPADMQMYAHWTGKEHISFIESIRGTSTNARALAKQFGLDLSQQARHLSTGNKQKLALIIALMSKPKLLILDEPTRGLDPILQEEIYDVLDAFTKDGGTVFISSHNLAEVEHICHRVTIIRSGKIVTSQTLADLRGATVHSVTVRFAKGIPKQTLAAIDADIISSTPKLWHLKVRGDINPILSVLANHPVTDVEITHASLEDVFMEFYQSPPNDSAGNSNE